MVSNDEKGWQVAFRFGLNPLVWNSIEIMFELLLLQLERNLNQIYCLSFWKSKSFVLD